jgi:hypothetical protein
MDCTPIADFASLIQFGAGLNLGVSVLYAMFEAHLNRLDRKLTVLETSASLVPDEKRSEYLSQRRSLAREVQIAAKSMAAPNAILGTILIVCGAYCVFLLGLIGFDAKSCDHFWIYTGTAATILPVPVGLLIHQGLVRYKFSQCWTDLTALEKAFFG